MLAVLEDLEQAYVGVPAFEIVQFADLDAVEALDDGEQAGKHLVHREVGTQRLLGHAVARLAEFLGVVAGVPALQFGAALLGGVGAQLLQVAGGERLAAHRQVAEEAEHLVAGLGHLGRQRQLGVVGEAEQAGQLLAQVEDLFHHRTVVVLPGVRALVGGAGAIGGVYLFAQGAVIGIGHHCVVAGELQADQPAVQALGLGGLLHLGLGRIGQAGQRGFVGDMLGPGLGGVEQLVGETATQLGQARLHLGIALLLVRRQVDAGQAEVAQGVFEDGFLGHVEAGRLGALRQRLVGLEQGAVLPQLGGVGRQLRQTGLVGLAQLGAVAHRVEVADRTPGGAQTVVEFVHRQHQALPGRLLALGFQQAGDGGAVIGEDPLDGRLHVFRANGGERRQVVGLQKGIRAHVGNLG